METLLGALLLAGLLAGLISWWLLPIMASLLLAVPLSALSALDLSRYGRGGLRMDSPNTLREPAIVTKARTERALFKGMLAVKLPVATSNLKSVNCLSFKDIMTSALL